MQKRLILFGGLFFLISILFMSIRVDVVRAEEDPCLYIRNCPVPAPTVVVPEESFSVYADKLIIAGLSWNETLVDVYVDGVFNGRATLNVDNSGIGNFSYTTFLPLNSGNHTVYTVARNLNEKERSTESARINFSIMAKPKLIIEDVVEEPVIKEAIVEPEEKEETMNEQEEVAEDPVITDEAIEQTVGVISEEVEADISVAPEADGRVNVNDGGQIEGGVWEEDEDSISNLQKTVDRDRLIDEFFSDDSEIFTEQRGLRERQNRQIGLAMLGVIIVISIVWVVISDKSGETEQENLIVKTDNEIKKPIENTEKIEDKMDDELDKLI